MKKFMSLVLVAIMAITLAACGGGSGSVKSSGGEESGVSSTYANASREKTLIVAVSDLCTGFDNDFQFSTQSMEVQRNIFDSPMTYELVEDAGGFLVPDFDKMIGQLCESWSMSEDGCTLTMTFKKGIMSHSGNELDADDFLWRWERGFALMGDLGTYGADCSKVTGMGDFKKIDQYTVSMTTEKPNPVAVAMQAAMISIMIDSDEYKLHDTDEDPYARIWASTNASGFGPWKVVEFVPDDRVVLERFDDYWDQDNLPWFEKVIIKEVPQSSNRATMLMSGDVDIAENLTNSELDTLRDAEGVKIVHYDGNQVFHMGFNNTIEPFNNPQVRQALSYAVPYNDILDAVWLGMAKQAKSVIPSCYPNYTDEFWNYGTDYEKAKSLLAEAGYANGFDMKLTIENTSPQMEQMAILIKDGFSQIGVNVEIEKLSSGDYTNKIAAKSFDSCYLCYDAAGTPDASFVIGLYANENANMNNGFYSNAEVNALYDEMTSTLDPETQTRCAMRIQEIVVREDPLWIYLVEPGFNLAVREDIQGARWDTIMQVHWKNMYRSE